MTHAEQASILQAFAAAGALAGTSALIAVTAYYASVTAKMVERNGPMIAVELKQAWVHPSGGGAVTLPLEKGIATTPRAPEYPVFMFAVEVRNSGGSAATIDKASIDMDQGVSFSQPAPSVGPACPFRLEAHSATTFFLEPQAIDAAVEALKLKSRKCRRRWCSPRARCIGRRRSSSMSSHSSR